MGFEKSTDVTTIREALTSQLKEQVDLALKNRQMYSPQEEIKSGKAMSQFWNLPDDTNLNFGNHPISEAEVVVDNPHDYPLLLRICYERLYSSGAWRPSLLNNATDIAETLKHEFEHHVPALGQGTVKIKYGVRFVETPDGATGFSAFIKVDGTMSVGVYKDVLSAVASPSPKDSAAVG